MCAHYIIFILLLILSVSAGSSPKVHDSGPEINHKNILNLTGKVRNYAKLCVYAFQKPDKSLMSGCRNVTRQISDNQQVRGLRIAQTSDRKVSGKGNVVWATEAWTDYTEKTGNGFYHDLIRLIIADTGIELDIKYVPWKRALADVRKGNADTTGVDMKTEGFLFSESPVFFNLEAVLVKKERITQWKGPESLKNMRGVWYLGYNEGSNPVASYLSGMEVKHRSQVISVLQKRAQVDYYYDNLDQLNQTLEKYGRDLDKNAYLIYSFRNNVTHWLFARTPQGKKFKSLFDRQFRRHYCSGELLKIYQRWQLEGEFPKKAVLCNGPS